MLRQIENLKNRLNDGLIRLFDTDYYVSYIEYKANNHEVYVFLRSDIYSHLVPVSLSLDSSEWDNYNKILETVYDKVASLTGQSWRRKMENESTIRLLEEMGVKVYSDGERFRDLEDIIDDISKIPAVLCPQNAAHKLVEMATQVYEDKNKER